MSLKHLIADVLGKPTSPPRHAASATDPSEPTPGPRPGAELRSNGDSKRLALGVAVAATVTALAVCVAILASGVNAASRRLQTPSAEQKPAVAIAQDAEVAYCTPAFKQVLERVLHSCGLAGAEQRRGCKPSDIKTFAAISDEDFNALFHPLRERGGVLLFDDGFDKLDDAAKALLDERWTERKGARYFFVVARASKTGTAAKNRALSHRRANSVLFHLEQTSGESKEELGKEVGLLWLGSEFAQLSGDYCQWPRSRPDGKCGEEAINRSAFVSWVDCRL